ncbi:MAG: S-methyl-5-thioribose-1-phosphate isomerase [Gammaproteobacteria bacterium]|nr:S-methyl-5-thioribose-1-phosphate isomerase [Gammaproteobacteria bacterium]
MLFDTIRAIRWENDHLYLLDQRRLPQERHTLECTQVTQVAEAITQMVVRGAPAIGITAAYGVVIAARMRYAQAGKPWKTAIAQDIDLLARTRPTAVNLFWALEHMRELIAHLPEDQDPVAALLHLARQLHSDDITANQHMGRLGAELITAGAIILTHCNTGSLATGGFGTALGVIRQAYADHKIAKLFADETRPWLQGSRLTAWELVQDNIPVTLIAEGAAAFLMQQQQVQWVIVGADRITANGDVANKIGTYGLAVLARQHGVKFMVVAPTSTLDMSLPEGAAIPIETRGESELLQLGPQRLAPAGVAAWNPVFDVTPAGLIDAIVTERGVVTQPDRQKLLAMMQNSVN